MRVNIKSSLFLAINEIAELAITRDYSASEQIYFMTCKLGIFGYPLSHSISPVFQQAALDALKINARYEAWEVPPSESNRRTQKSYLSRG